MPTTATPIAAPDDRVFRVWRIVLGLGPAVFVPGLADLFMLPKLVVLAVATTWALVTLGPVGRGGPRVPRAVAGSAVAVAIVLLLATVTSVAPRLSVVGIDQRFGGLAPFAVHLGAAWVTMRLIIGRPDRAFVVARWVAGGATAIGLYAIVQDLGWDAFEFREASGAATRFPGSTIGNSNFAGGYLAIAIVLTLATAVRSRGRARTVWAVALATQVGGLWVTQSRGGMLATSVGVALWACVAATRRAPRSVAMVVLIASVAAVTGAAAFIAGPPDRRLPHAVRSLEVLRSDSAVVRGYEWRAAVRATIDRPVLGNGLDTFALTYPPHRETRDGATIGLLLSDKPHNLWLEWLVSTGVVGLSAFGSLIVCAVWASRRARQRSPDDRSAHAMVVAAFVAYLVQATFSIDVVPLASTGWWLLGMIVAFGCEPAPTVAKSRAAGPKGGTRRPLRIAAIATVSAASVVALAASFMVDRGQRVEGRHPAQAYDWYQRARALAPEESAYQRSAGFAAEQAAVAAGDDRAAAKQHIADAIAAYEEALDRQPGNVGILIDLARVHLLRAQRIDPRGYEESARWWDRAVELDPHDWELRELAGVAYNEWANRVGDTDARRRAAEQLSVVVELRPDYYNGWLNLARTQIALDDFDGAQQSIDAAFTIVPFSAPAIEVAEELERAKARSLSS